MYIYVLSRILARVRVREMRPYLCRASKFGAPALIALRGRVAEKLSPVVKFQPKRVPPLRTLVLGARPLSRLLLQLRPTQRLIALQKRRYQMAVLLVIA